MKHIVKCDECNFEKEADDYQDAEHVQINHIHDEGHDGVHIVSDAHCEQCGRDVEFDVTKTDEDGFPEQYCKRCDAELNEEKYASIILRRMYPDD